jgi:hypothetical protein
LHEIAGGGNGVVDGAAAGLFAAGIAARTRGKVLWCVTRQDLFAPAIAQAGLGPDRVIYVEAGDEKSLLACFEEGLRHGGLGAVVAEVARLSMMASRRLHLAAESSGAIGIAERCIAARRMGPRRSSEDSMQEPAMRTRAAMRMGGGGGGLHGGGGGGFHGAGGAFHSSGAAGLSHGGLGGVHADGGDGFAASWGKSSGRSRN